MKAKLKKVKTVLVLSAITLGLSGCSNMCAITGHDFTSATCVAPQVCSKCGEVAGEALGHTWIAATCISAKTCTVCGETEGEPLSVDGQHTWVESSCTEPKTCTVCGETEGDANGHEYSDVGVCTICNATKAYSNSYGYFSKTDLYNMGQHAIEEYLYPDYVDDYAPSSEITLEKADESLYGNDCFVVVFYADVTHNSSTSQGFYAVVIKPTTSSSYTCVDVYVY